VFNKCEFLLGDDNTVLIVIPVHLPKAETYTVSFSDRDIRFKAGYDDVAVMPYQSHEVFRRIIHNTQVGLVEYTPGIDEFPTVITNVAYVEIRRAA